MAGKRQKQDKTPQSAYRMGELGLSSTEQQRYMNKEYLEREKLRAKVSKKKGKKSAPKAPKKGKKRSASKRKDLSDKVQAEFQRRYGTLQAGGYNRRSTM